MNNDSKSLSNFDEEDDEMYRKITVNHVKEFSRQQSIKRKEEINLKRKIALDEI
jgi:hypothetical protein